MQYILAVIYGTPSMPGKFIPDENARKQVLGATTSFLDDKPKLELTMVLILDGSSEIGAQERSKICYLICLRHLIRSRSNFSSEKT